MGASSVVWSCKLHLSNDNDSEALGPEDLVLFLSLSF